MDMERVLEVFRPVEAHAGQQSNPPFAGGEEIDPFRRERQAKKGHAPIERKDVWQVLIDSGKSDMDVTNLDEALFLFAFRKIEQTSVGDLPAVWDVFGPYWKKRMPAEAFKMVEELRRERGQRR